jgi:Novel STAND NTPase 1
MTEQLRRDAPPFTGEVVVEAETQEGTSGYRYPGSPPFADTDVDRLVFRGRAREIDQVLHSILSVDLFLVYAISGLGKTSLLTAGVLEPLRQRGFFPVIVRLNDPERSPVELIDAQIRAAGDKAGGIQISRHPSMHGSQPTTLWDLLGGLEIWRGNTLQRLVVIFDQFEELFTLGWSDEDRGRFIEQLGQVLRRHRTLSDQPEPVDDSPVPPPEVKITLIIREDSLGELEAMAEHVPQIMRHRFRLEGLSPEQAKAAIREPAAVNDPRLRTQRFAYSDGAAEAILNFLQAKEVRQGPGLKRSIDPSQLQIICQHIERSILVGKQDDSRPDSIVEISEADLGGKEGLDRILRDFYRNELARFTSSDRKLIRHLCESGLINQNGRRLSLEEGEICDEFKLTKATLEELVDRRLLRAEPRVGSVYYELAHDTLTAPILAYRDESRAVSRRRRRRVIAAAIGLVILAGVVALIWNASRADESPRDAGVEEIALTGNIRQGGDSVSFEFDVPQDRSLAIDVEPTSELDVLLEVFYPDGKTRFANDAGAGGLEHVVLAGSAPGRYEVAVTGSSPGEFDLTVAPIEDTALNVGQPLTGTIAGENDARAYAFEAPGDQPLAIEVVPVGTLDAVLEVKDAKDYDRVAKSGGLGQAETLLVPAGSRYRILVSGSGATSGDFELSAQPAEVVEMNLGDTVSGSVGNGVPGVVYGFDAPDDQPVIVEVAPNDGVDIVLDVKEPNGSIDHSDTAGEGGSAAGGTEGVILGAAGRSWVLINPYESLAGGYDLSVRPAEVTQLKIGDSVSGTIRGDGTGSIVVYSVDTPNDRPVTIELVPDDKLDAVLGVRMSDGSVNSNDAGPEGQIESLTIEDAGHHLIGVWRYRGHGDFTLSIRSGE